MKNQFPKNYPAKLKPYSWNINGKCGIMPYFTKYCDCSCQRQSPIFLRNCLEVILRKHDIPMTPQIIVWMDYFVKCFSVSFDEDLEDFKVNLKFKNQNNVKKQVFEPKTYAEISQKIGFDKSKASLFLKWIVKLVKEYYLRYIN